jgi:hypothetical protein
MTGADGGTRADDDRVMMVGGDGTVALVDPVTGTASAGAAVGTFAYQLLKDRRAAVDPRKPIFVAVTATYTRRGTHRVELQFTNEGRHACYIEAIELAAPVRMSIDASVPSGEIGLGSTGVESLPRVIKPNASVVVEVRFPELADNQTRGTLAGVFEFTYTVAGIGDKPRMQEVEFRIRLADH